MKQKGEKKDQKMKKEEQNHQMLAILILVCGPIANPSFFLLLQLCLPTVQRVCMCVCVCARVVRIIVKHPLLPPCVVDEHHRNPPCYYY